MANLTFDIAGFTATHQLTQAHQDRLLAVMKVRMAQTSGWPMDLSDPDNPKRRESTNAELAQWMADEYIMLVIKEDVFEEEKRIAKNTAANAVTRVESAKV